MTTLISFSPILDYKNGTKYSKMRTNLTGIINVEKPQY